MATTKAGKPCPFFAGAAAGLCTSHDPAQRDELRARAKRGGVTRGEQTRRPQRQQSHLRCVADIQDLVERMALQVENGTGDITARAGAAAKLATLALELLKAGELERENAELKALIAEHIPETRSALRAVK